MNRALIYKQNGDPASVLSAVSYPPLPPPSASSVNVRVALAPINPSDIGAIGGWYPQASPSALPFPATDELQSVFVPGNEGLGVVNAVGSEVEGLAEGDWVVIAKKQAGTWSTEMSLSEHQVIKIPKLDGLSPVHVATINVNPATAYNMLKDFVDLQPGDWITQNASNSAVGQAVIQIAAARGCNTINFIRNKENVEELKQYLVGLGANHVLTYDDLEDPSLPQRVKEWTGVKDVCLFLNCVGDKSTTQMLALLGKGAQVITYGRMADTPLEIPASVFIFQDLVFRGYWQTRWYAEKSREERVKLVEELVKLMAEGKLKEPAHEIMTISGNTDDETATKTVQEIMSKVHKGTYGKKVLMKIEMVV